MWDTYFFSVYSDKLMLPDAISGSIKSVSLATKKQHSYEQGWNSHEHDCFSNWTESR